MHNTAAGLRALDEEEDTPEEPSAALPQMELQPVEHYDYIMLMFRNDQDFQQACELLKIKKVQVTYPGGRVKVGLGRVIDGAMAIRMLTTPQATTAPKDAPRRKAV